MAYIAILKLIQDPRKLNILVSLDFLFLGGIVQVSSELLSVLDIILHKLRNNNVFIGELLIIFTILHT